VCPLENMFLLSVIVLAYNNMEFTRRCLESIFDSELPRDCEVLLFDNGSTDRTPDLGKELASRCGAFVYIRNDANLILSAAFNKAAGVARGEYLLFVNNDIVVNPRSIEILLKAMAAEKSVGVAGCKLFYPERKLIQHAGVVPMLWGYPINNGWQAAAADPRFDDEAEMFAVTGAMFLVRQSAFSEVGGFDEGFRWGLEDIDLCLKIRNSGYRILYLPDAEAIHFESLTVGRDEPRELANYQLYRKRWGQVLRPREKAFVDAMVRKGVRQVVIFGTGRASRILFEIMGNSKISVVGFVTSDKQKEPRETLFDKHVCGLENLADVPYDAMIIGSQFYYSIENLLPKLAVFPII